MNILNECVCKGKIHAQMGKCLFISMIKIKQTLFLKENLKLKIYKFGTNHLVVIPNSTRTKLWLKVLSLTNLREIILRIVTTFEPIHVMATNLDCADRK